MKSCCQPDGPPASPWRRALRFGLYALLAAVLGFMLWQQFGA